MKLQIVTYRAPEDKFRHMETLKYKKKFPSFQEMIDLGIDKVLEDNKEFLNND